MVKVIAHRAGKSMNGENTLDSAKSSIKLNCDYIEIDVRQTSDGCLVVANKDEIEGSHSKLIHKSAFEEIKKFNINKLADFIDLVNNNVSTGLVIDLKVDVDIDTLLKTIKTILNNVVIMSKNHDLLKKINTGKQIFKLAYLSPTFDLQTIKKIDKNIDIIAIGDKSTKPTTELIQFSKKRELEVWAFTINNITKMKHLVKIGIEGIITDYPQNVSRMLKKA